MNDMHTCLSDLSNVPQKLRRHKTPDRNPGRREASSSATSLETSPTIHKPIRPLILLIPRPPIWTPRSVGWKHLFPAG